MDSKKQYPIRKLNRLKRFDYSSNGCYFVTLCTKDRFDYFSVIHNEKLILNTHGLYAKDCWLKIPEHFPCVNLGDFVIMPNHIHGIIFIDNAGEDYKRNNNHCSLQEPVVQSYLTKSLSSIIRGFKIGVTKFMRENGYPDFQWQKSFYDHIVRNQKSLEKIRAYINENPVNWKKEQRENILVNLGV